MTRFLLIAMSLIVTACACQKTVVTNGVPNLRQVDPGVWRGGQPDLEGWGWLETIGVSHVLKLNGMEEGVDAMDVLDSTNLTYLPISIAQQLTHVPTPVVMEAVASIKPGTYIHCSHGQDRTGLICAVYRVKHDGWTKAQAENEMLASGFHKELHGLWDWWTDWKP